MFANSLPRIQRSDETFDEIQNFSRETRTRIFGRANFIESDSPNKVLAVAAESGLLEESRDEFVSFDIVNIFLL